MTGRGGRTLWREQPQEGIDATGPSGSVGQNELAPGSTPCSRPRSWLPQGGREPVRNARRVEAPERGPDRCEENALKGEARGRSSLRKEARRVGGGRREGGTQTPDVARRRVGRPARERVRRSGTCRGAQKPTRGSIVRRAGPSGLRGTVRGCCDGPSKRDESVGGGPRPEQSGPGGSVSRKPGGRGNAERADGTSIRPARSSLCPRSAA
jgi:hypothetical protein